MKELDFNIGKSRTEFIGELVNASTNAYIYAKVKPKEKNIFKYYGYLSALTMELMTYVDSDSSDESNTEKQFSTVEDKIEEIEDTLSEKGYRPDGDTEMYGDENYLKILNELKEVQKKLSEMRAEIGLDIPSSSNLDPEDAGMGGL